MHEYYKQKSNRLQKTMRGFLALVRPELENATKKDYDTAFEEIWTIYQRDMLQHFPFIGGDDASGTKNLTESYILLFRF